MWLISYFESLVLFFCTNEINLHIEVNYRSNVFKYLRYYGATITKMLAFMLVTTEYYSSEFVFFKRLRLFKIAT